MHYSNFAAACNNKIMWAYVAVISTNIIVAKDMGVLFHLFYIATEAGIYNKTRDL